MTPLLPLLTVLETIVEASHKKTNLKVYVIVIPKEGLADGAPPILLLV